MLFSKTLFKDIAERAIFTFLEVALAVVVAAGTNFINVATWKAAAVGGTAAVFAVILGFIRSLKGDPESASAVQ